MNGPSVLVTGDFLFQIYEPDFCEGLRNAGARVIEVPVRQYYGPDLFWRAQSKYVVGPAVALSNAALLRAVARERPDFVLAWRTPWLWRSTLRACQTLGARVVLYNNDDPFGPDRDKAIWRRFRKLIPVADACFAYRAVNVEEYKEVGARRVGILRSYFNPRLHRPVELSAADRAAFGCDVVFAGHCEADGRADAMERLLGSGLRVRLFGLDWEKFLSARTLRRIGPIKPLYGEAYVKAVAAAKVGLVFLSRRNRDQYTRRCFEIPAIGTMMLAPRTDELRSLYREGEEAVFFGDTGELVDLCRRYVQDDARRAVIAAAGHDRCVRGGHDVDSRATAFLEELSSGG